MIARNIKSTLILLVALFSYGCSNGVVVSPKHCRTSGFWSESEAKSDFDIEVSSWSFFSKKTVLLKEVLASKKVKCEKVGNLNITLSKNLLSAALSIVPFISRVNIRAVGKFKSNVMEDLKSKDQDKY